jgi:hypothetical protein
VIADINDFVASFKQVTQNHIDIYSNKASNLRKWGEADFDTDALTGNLDATNSILLYACIKKAYDLIRCYHRAYLISLQTRGDYYRAASHDREKDSLIIDIAVNNLQKVHDNLTNGSGVV